MRVRGATHFVGRVWAISAGKRPLWMGLSVFIWEDSFIGYWVGGLFQKLGGKGRDFQELGQHPLLTFNDQPWNCHRACGCVISTSGCDTIRVYWGLESSGVWLTRHLWLSGFWPLYVVSSKLCPSFEDCALPCLPVLLFEILMYLQIID